MITLVLTVTVLTVTVLTVTVTCGENKYGIRISLCARVYCCVKAPREKVPNVLSQCQTKRGIGARGCAHPSFGITPTLRIFF